MHWNRYNHFSFHLQEKSSKEGTYDILTKNSLKMEFQIQSSAAVVARAVVVKRRFWGQFGSVVLVALRGCSGQMQFQKLEEIDIVSFIYLTMTSVI